MSDHALSGVEGVVKWFDPRKGFGFIVGPSGQDIFVHYSVILGDGFRVLKDGSPVRYDAEQTAKGWRSTRAEAIARASEEGAGLVEIKPPELGQHVGASQHANSHARSAREDAGQQGAARERPEDEGG